MRKLFFQKGPIVFAAMLLFFVLMTFLVWKQQVMQRQSMTQRHTDDICTQTTRRIQILMESTLQNTYLPASLCGASASAGIGPTCRQIAETFMQRGTGIRRIAYVHPDGSEDRFGVSSDSTEPFPRPTAGPPRDLNPAGIPTLSPVYLSNNKTPLVATFVSTGHGNNIDGYLKIELDLTALIESFFKSGISSEFYFTLKEGETVLFHSERDFPRELSATEIGLCIQPVAIGNRTWQLMMIPKAPAETMAAMSSHIPILVFGLLLSLGLALSALLLVRRMVIYRNARDHAFLQIDEREKAEAGRKETEVRYRNVFNAVTDGLVVLNREGIIIEANRAAAEMHGFDPLQTVGRPVSALIAPEKLDWVAEFDRQLSEQGEVRLDSVHIHRDGGRIDVEVRGSRLIKYGKEQRLAIISDVSDRKRALERQAVLSRKAIEAQEEERGRLSKEMHDELGQILTALRLDLGLIRKQHESSEGAEFLSNAMMMAEKATDELRRLCKGLRPPLLDDLGLEPALQLLADEFQAQSDIKLQLTLPEENRSMSREASLCAYRIAQESLTNVRRHSLASSVVLSLSYTHSGIELFVQDDGKGFNATDLGAIQGCGIQGITERANLAGGHADILSTPGEGTTIIFRAPYFMAKGATISRPA